MLGNFTYFNPVRIHFGPESLNRLSGELDAYGKRVLLVYGNGSAKKYGIYDRVKAVLDQSGAEVAEISGVMPNPTVAKVLEGVEVLRHHQTDLILAVGGGSVIDYCKALSAAAYCEEDPWQKFYLQQQEPNTKLVPIGSVLTMVGTGSEMNGGSVITNTETGLKIGKVFGPANYPKFSILNPQFTMTLPKRQMVSGIFDIMSHIMEQYFSGEDDNTSDYVSEGLMRSLIHSSVIADRDPTDYEARSNIMWTATLALNTLIGMSKSQDWEVHMIGHAISAHTDATHGLTLASVTLPYFRRIREAGLKKFRRFAENVWHVRGEGRSDEEVAEEGLQALEAWMRSLGLPLNCAELGVTEALIEPIVRSTIILQDGYKVLTHQDVAEILIESMQS